MGKKVRYRLLLYMFIFLFIGMGNIAMAQEVNQILQGAEEGSEEERDKLESDTFQETSLEETREGGNIEEEEIQGKDSRKEAETEEHSGRLPKEQQQEEKQAEEDEIPIEKKKDQTSSDEDSGENKEEKGEEDSSNEGEGSSQNQEQREESSEQSTKEEASKDGLVLTDLDLGDYREEMVTGEKQLLFVTPIPSQYAADKLSFTSSDSAVAQINGLGRITAIKPGKTTIHVQLETISRSFELTVKEAENTRILVSGIEVQEYTKELEEGKTLSLSVTLLPRNATKQEVTFTSMHTSVATVNSTGVVKGIKKGKTEIELQADGYSKKIPIEVIVKTKQIKVEPAYVILKTGESHTLQTKVIPEQADQQVTYKSKEEEIAEITQEGVITARKKGNTTILISNHDMSASVTVIVNEDVDYQKEEKEEEDRATPKVIIHQSVYAKEKGIISSAVLEQLYERKENLLILGDDYEIEIQGNKIINEKTYFLTNIYRTKEEDKEFFLLNEGKDLCGEVILRLKDPIGAYLYLYNDEKEKYQQIEVDNIEELILTTPGKYMILKEKQGNLPDYLIPGCIGASIVLFVLGIIYIATKKKYWFW